MNGLKENECPDLLTLVKARSSVRSFKSSQVDGLNSNIFWRWLDWLRRR